MDMPKKKLQANVDLAADNQVKAILSRLGLSSSAVINMLWNRIAAEGRIPFSLKLTDEEMANIRLAQAAQDTKAPILTDPDQIRAYILEDEDDDY